MKDQRQKLLELIEELNFPVTREEAERDVREYTDEQVADLISLYSDITEYEKGMEDFVRESAPEEYKKIADKRDEEINKVDSEYEHELEKEQEEEDIKLDSLDVQEERKIEEEVKPVEELADIVDEIESEVEKAVKSSE